MGRRRARALMLATLATGLIAAAAFAWIGRNEPAALPARAPGERPDLMLVTTLPLIFPETFSLEGGGSRALEVLERRYDVRPIGVTDGEALRQGDLLLMAHPLAQPAEALVALDAWVRDGGRVLILADPKLDWHSDRPLGDKLRAPPAFADTGLLAHWGLKLHGPAADGPAERGLGGSKVLAVSPGEITGGCAISQDRFVARCSIGKGRATIVADADFLNVEDIDGPTQRNLQAVVAELAGLER